MDQDIDPDRIDEAVLALLWLGRHNGGWRTWKGFDSPCCVGRLLGWLRVG
jgi:hypothetical protein